jgi:hydantoinase/carbamoylase family amidase
MDARRMLNTLAALAETANATPGNGVTRFSWSTADKAARTLLAGELEAMGLAPWTDGIGNMHAVYPGTEKGPRVIIGSHLDTVRFGGRLDGTLGVVAALEALRSLHDEGLRPVRDIEFIAFAEEEGSNYGCTCLGSKAAMGMVGPEDLKSLRNAQGSCYDALRAFGLDPDALPGQRIDSADVHAFLELHIEQNARLEQAGRRLGVVTSICGMRLRRVTLSGKSDHAASPMQGRRDPMAGFAEFAHRMEGLWKQGTLPEDFSCTVGSISCSPDVGIIIPSSVTFTVDLRHVDKDILEQGWDILEKLLLGIAEERGLECRVDLLSASGGSRMDAGVQEAFIQAARGRGEDPMLLPSGPAHDAAAFGASGIPTGMLFVPSIGGLSHCPEENTAEEDLLLGAQVLEDALRALAGAQ